MNKVLVTGATGFIGYEVARQLVAAGIDTRLMVRRPWPAPDATATPICTSKTQRDC